MYDVQGGGLYAWKAQTELLLLSTIFDGNAAPGGDGSALFVQAPTTGIPDSTKRISLTNCTFRNAPSTATVITALAELRWSCKLGQWSPVSGNIEAMDFTGCARTCDPGTVGPHPYLTAASQCEPCVRDSASNHAWPAAR